MQPRITVAVGTRATSNAGLESECSAGLANRHKRAWGACSPRASARVEAGVRAGVEADPKVATNGADRRIERCSFRPDPSVCGLGSARLLLFSGPLAPGYRKGDQAQLRDAAVPAVGEQADARTGDRQRSPLSVRSFRVKASFQRLACSVGARPYLGRRSPACGARDVMVDRSSRGATAAARSLSGSPMMVGSGEAAGAGCKLSTSQNGGDEGAGVRPRARSPLGPVRGEGGSCVGRSCVRSSATLECE